MAAYTISAGIFSMLWFFGLPSPAGAIEHDTNLIWAQSPIHRVYTVSRLVSIQGDPDQWATSKKQNITYVSAPHFSWEFKALGFHWDYQTIYWSESMNKKIQGLVLNGSTETTTVFSGTSPEVWGIAVDWLSQNIYFTDALYNWIMMTPCNPKQVAYRIVVPDNLGSPHGVAVHPKKNMLVWSDWGVNPRIEASDLLGQGRRSLVERDIGKPRGLTIDYVKDSLYWVDSFKDTVEVVGLNGQGRRVIFTDEGSSFYGVAVYNDFIFVTEKSKGLLKVFNKEQNVLNFTLVSNSPFDVVMYDASQQPHGEGELSECDKLDCDQMCVLDPSVGAKCLCGEGYEPQDALSRTCKQSLRFSHPSHIYAIGDSICQYPANVADMMLNNVTLDSQCFLEDKQGYMTLAFDARENMMYYFGNNTKNIFRIPLRLGGKGKVLTGGTGVVRGMALDWVAGNLYWTDSEHGDIKVAKKTGAYQRAILRGLHNPWGIVVHPRRGKIYWSDHGHLPDIAAKLESANLDGSGRENLPITGLAEPNHLFIDFSKDFLYWSDSIRHHVRMYDLNTRKTRLVYTQDHAKFNGLSIFKDFILWTDTEDLNGIHVARMDKKEKVRGIIHPRNGKAADLITFDINNQPAINNSCSEAATECSQLCLLSEDQTPKCFCGMGYRLMEDGLNCTATPVPDKFILINDAYQKQIFQMDLDTRVVEAVDMQPVHEPIAVEYDPVHAKVYWSDNKQRVIRSATIHGEDFSTVMFFNNMSMCDGLASDYINRLLFYTDTGNNVIGVISMDNYDFYVHIIDEDLDEPRDIVVSPNQHMIYWSDWGKRPRIESAYMDGNYRDILVNFTAPSWPNGLTLDLQENRLYWVDANADTITTIDLATRKVTTLLEEPGSHYFSVDIIGDYLYISDWKLHSLRRMHKRGGSLKGFGPDTFTRLYGIKGYNSTEAFKGRSVCADHPCEHICLPTRYSNFSCRCHVDFLANGRRCDTTRPTTLSTTLSTTIITTTVAAQSTTSSASSISTSRSVVTMTPSATTDSAPTETVEINTTIPPRINHSLGATTKTPGVSVSGVGKVGKSTVAASSQGLSALVLGLIVALIVIVVAVVIVAAILFYRRRHVYKIHHGKLVEEKNPADFYKIAFPGKEEDSVMFDTGIENPIYDCLNDPTYKDYNDPE